MSITLLNTSFMSYMNFHHPFYLCKSPLIQSRSIPSDHVLGFAARAMAVILASAFKSVKGLPSFLLQSPIMTVFSIGHCYYSRVPLFFVSNAGHFSLSDF